MRSTRAELPCEKVKGSTARERNFLVKSGGTRPQRNLGSTSFIYDLIKEAFFFIECLYNFARKYLIVAIVYAVKPCCAMII